MTDGRTGPSLEFLVPGSPRVWLELATDPESRARGLMGREQLAPCAGMLFVFPDETRAAFWGRDVPIALSVAFISTSGEILELLDLTPHDPAPRRPSRVYRFALEVNRGWFQAHGISSGALVQYVSADGPLIVR